jgi:hypothetical protein
LELLESRSSRIQEELVLDMRVQSSDVPTLFIVIKVGGKFDMLEEFQHPAAPALAALVGDEDELTARPVFEFVVFYHGS